MTSPGWFLASIIYAGGQTCKWRLWLVCFKTLCLKPLRQEIGRDICQKITLPIKANQNMPNPSIHLHDGGLDSCERAINNFRTLGDMRPFKHLLLLFSKVTMRDFTH